MDHEWKQFRVGKLPQDGTSKDDCKPLAGVYHVSHVASSIEIIETGTVRQSLVHDDTSKLNDKRILVSWVSPRHWFAGHRYGTIRFTFDFLDLIKDKPNYYWVEVGEYKTPAPRILITDQNRDSLLPRYDPCKGDGPWWHDKANDRHYFNDQICCLEFMIESPLHLWEATKFDFVNHRSDMCSIHPTDPSRCKEASDGLGDFGGARLLARGIVSGLNFRHIVRFLIDGEGKPTGGLPSAFNMFVSQFLTHNLFHGQLKEGSPLSLPIMRAVMGAYAFCHVNESFALASLFSSSDIFVIEAAKLVANAINLPNWQELVCPTPPASL
jgi:hypothetical protein